MKPKDFIFTVFDVPHIALKNNTVIKVLSHNENTIQTADGIFIPNTTKLWTSKEWIKQRNTCH
jgi:hypothetical protein